jgi:hypothetical protein
MIDDALVGKLPLFYAGAKDRQGGAALVIIPVSDRRRGVDPSEERIEDHRRL